MSLQRERKSSESSFPGIKSAKPLKVFISHASADNAFVDGVATNLEQQGFPTLVYRPKVMEGPDWRREVENLIDQSQALLVILSPDAVKDEHVRIEYSYAAQQKKAVIPALYRPIQQVDVVLNQVPWVALPENNQQGLKQAMQALTLTAMLPAGGLNRWLLRPMPMANFTLVAPQHVPFPTPPSLEVLYEQGIVAENKGNWDYAVFLWQQILDTNPGFKHGTLRPRLLELRAKLRPIQIRRLRHQAEHAYAKGIWSLEIAAWEALEKLATGDSQARKRVAKNGSQARSRIVINKINQRFDHDYDVARSLVRDGDPAAKTQLKYLWKVAPLYPDPDQLAPKVGLPSHPGLVPLPLALRRGSSSGAGWGLCLGIIVGALAFANSFDVPITWIGLLAGLVGCLLVGGVLALLGRTLDKSYGRIATRQAILHCILLGGSLGLLVDTIDSVFLLGISTPITFVEALLGGLGAGCFIGIIVGAISYLIVRRRTASARHLDKGIASRASFIWRYCIGTFAIAGAGIIMIPYYFMNTTQPATALFPGLVGGILVSLLMLLALVPLSRSYPTKAFMFAVFGLSGAAIGVVGGSVLGYTLAQSSDAGYQIFLDTTGGFLIGGIILALIGGLLGAVVTLFLVQARYSRAIDLYNKYNK